VVAPLGVVSRRGGKLALGKRYLVKPLRRNVSPMPASDANRSVEGSGTTLSFEIRDIDQPPTVSGTQDA